MLIPGVKPSEDKLLKDFIRYRNNFWDFATECLYTIDQASKQIRPYPQAGDESYVYLKYVTERMIEESLLALVKHRRMVITWGGVCSISTWDAMFHEATDIGIISKKEEDSDDLVKRCKFQLENLPKSKLLKIPKWDYKYTELRFPEIDSRIKGIAMGADQARQYTFSRVFIDEAAFQSKCRETFVGLKPTLEGGGKLCMVSTRYPGFFQELIEDTLND